MRSIVLLWVLASSGIASAQIQNPGNGHWYSGFPSHDFHGARTIATASGGTLVAIADADEQQWVIDEFTESIYSVLWLGLTDELTEGTFVWDSGDPLTYTNWQPGEPADGSTPGHPDDYVRLRMLTGGQWEVTYSANGGGVVIESLTEPTVPVASVFAVPGVLAVTLEWQNPIAYDTIEVYRNGAWVADIPGSSTSYFDQDPIAVLRRYAIIGKVIGSPATPAFGSATAIDPAYELSIPPAQSNDGSPVTAHVMLDNDELLQGWSYGVCHDDALVALISVEMGTTTSTVWNGFPPAFYAAALHPGGFTVGVVVALDSHVLPAGQSHELDRAIYEPLVAAPAQVPLEFCDTLGAPPVAIMVYHQGDSHSPVTIDGVIDLVATTFIRADCNGDLAPDIADVIFLGDHLFGNGTAPPCRAACDSNSDEILDVADMVFTASALFAGGPLPAPPFPDCGLMPSTVLDCVDPALCP